MSKNFESWWNDYLWFTAKNPSSRLLERHANFLWHVEQGEVRRAGLKNNLLCSGDIPNVEFYSRSLVSSCVGKGLFNFESLTLGQAAVDMFSAVAGFAATRYLDLPDDAPRPVTTHKAGRPRSRFSSIWRTVPQALQLEFSRALLPLVVKVRYQPAPGFLTIVKSYKDKDSGNEYSEVKNEARFYFNNLKWRVLTTESADVAGLAVDVLKSAFQPMFCLQRSHTIVQPDKLNTSPEAVNKALADPQVQTVLTKLQPLFYPAGKPGQCLTFTYDPTVVVPATKLNRIAELEAELAHQKEHNRALYNQNIELTGQLKQALDKSTKL